MGSQGEAAASTFRPLASATKASTSRPTSASRFGHCFPSFLRRPPRASRAAPSTWSSRFGVAALPDALRDGAEALREETPGLLPCGEQALAIRRGSRCREAGRLRRRTRVPPMSPASRVHAAPSRATRPAGSRARSPRRRRRSHRRSPSAILLREAVQRLHELPVGGGTGGAGLPEAALLGARGLRGALRDRLCGRLLAARARVRSAARRSGAGEEGGEAQGDG